MTIDVSTLPARPLAVVGAQAQETPPSPHVHPLPEESPTPRGTLSSRRPTVSSLRSLALQSLPVVRANHVPPGAHSTDSQLATVLENGFGLLHPYLKFGQLTQSSLQHLAARALGESDRLDSMILAVNEILRRPRLNDAIINGDGYITRDSLRYAAQVMTGNSAPSDFSEDPFHSQGNALVVQAFQGEFDRLRDKAKDRTVFFEKYQFVEIAALAAVMADPNELDSQGSLVLEASTGLPRKLYSEHCVYTVRNILERPGLLSSLQRAAANGLGGLVSKEGWLSNKSLERWLKQEKVNKAR